MFRWYEVVSWGIFSIFVTLFYPNFFRCPFGQRRCVLVYFLGPRKGKKGFFLQYKKKNREMVAQLLFFCIFYIAMRWLPRI